MRSGTAKDSPGSGRQEASGSAFRADIQGLRAIAVLLVVAFHTGVLPIPGGYIGVDVFFVISGFLITGQIVSRIEREGRLDLGDFYARRARRILPASFTVLLLTLVASVLFLPPALRQGTLWDALWTALYGPNVAFAVKGTDYLAETAPSPFQHYWSLGVEEQFYLVFPLLLVVLWVLTRRRRGVVLIAVVAITVASLVFGWVLTYTVQPWAFFGLPARAWELGTGAILALAGPGVARRLPAWARAVISWTGLAAILVCGLRFDESIPFPGGAAVLPVLGAAALVFAGDVRWGSGLLLRRSPMQFIGRISYSWYLVHWEPDPVSRTRSLC